MAGSDGPQTPEARADRVLSLLGLARRAGFLVVGQDRVLGAVASGLFIVVSEDCSPAVLRKIGPKLKGGGSVCHVIKGVSRERLGRSVGVNSAQIAAIPINNGFVRNLAELLQ
jgi:ribosomal protein L7Ae-like RNA K-turn-binding protein